MPSSPRRPQPQNAPGASRRSSVKRSPSSLQVGPSGLASGASLRGQRERDVPAAGTAPRRLAAAGGAEEERGAGGRGAGGRRVARRGQRPLPQQRAGRLVEGAELPIVIRGRDEHEAAGGDDGTAVVLAARVFQPLRDELGIFAE